MSTGATSGRVDLVLAPADVPARRPRFRGWPVAVALLPMAAVVVVVYIGCMLWTVRLSMTSSRLLPIFDFVGLDQYERLFSNARFLVSLTNMATFGVLYIAGCLALGFLLAVFIDQRVKAEGAFRTIYLYPHALSFIVTGLAWQWFLNPQLGLQKVVRDLGLTGFEFAWLADRDTALYALVIAAIWQSAGLVMAILLAGLRGVDAELWRAARVDGIPAWRYYAQIVLPLLGPMLMTATVLLAIQVVKLYDLVVAMTNGGPGNATEVPAKFVMDHLFERSNVGLGTAAATVMLGITIVAVLAPWLYSRTLARRRA
jgi:glucose/mannose transport system permease protein